jgi:cytidylate kinase
MAIFTISRQFGAGGKTLGLRLAKRLDYTFAGSEVIQKIAEVANVSPAWVESVEKEAGTRVSALISRMVSRSLVDKILKEERGYLDDDIYLDYLVLTISEIAEEGNAVILGRGSQYILKNEPDTYHILLTDEFDNRVRFMMVNYDLSAGKATRMVQSEDRRRDNLYSKLGKSDYDSPNLYHMVLNMGKLSLDTAENLIVQLVS